ncbi:suppressor protein SRP40-like [Pyrus ussuriensis x Pyrus communis]|uniref:Suppressor protein SRP40-like n=1 Tax=Pyrus ussuriensis x Pyrus communis TaxID=2448454 RepID=A0A5N5H6W4_9ROSA|nr:suppressor protein SRP40-like [Pyrus ussuriensis x Pyrus communis]
MASSRKSACPRVLKGKTPAITPSFSPPRTRSVKRKLFSSPSDCSASPDINFSQAVFQQMLDLNKKFSLLERFIKSSTNDLSHRISNLEQCFHRLPNHLFAPLIHISSSDDEDDFHPDCVPSSPRPPCPPIPDHSPLPTLTPEDDPEEDPEEDPEDDQDYDLYWVSDDDVVIYRLS